MPVRARRRGPSARGGAGVGQIRLREVVAGEEEGLPRRGRHGVRQAVPDKIADSVIYAFVFAHASGIDLGAAVRKKLEENREKHLVERAGGSARKYTALGDAAE